MVYPGYRRLVCKTPAKFAKMLEDKKGNKNLIADLRAMKVTDFGIYLVTPKSSKDEDED